MRDLDPDPDPDFDLILREYDGMILCCVVLCCVVLWVRANKIYRVESHSLSRNGVS